MPFYVTPEQLRRLQGGAAPAADTGPKVKAPRRQPEGERDAGDARRQPYCDRWLFAQVGADLQHIACSRKTDGLRVGPAGTLQELLQLIDAQEGGVYAR